MSEYVEIKDAKGGVQKCSGDARDPRRDPLPGDVLCWYEKSTKPLRRRVNVVSEPAPGLGLGFWVFYENQNMQPRACRLKAWREWAVGATVERTGDNDGPTRHRGNPGAPGKP